MTARRIVMLCRGLWLLIVVLLTSSSAGILAQGQYGSVRGVVRDASAVVPGVEIVMANEATGVAKATTTNGVGEYSFPSVDPGVFTLSASFPGFKSFESRGLRVGTSDTLAVDILLAVGDVRESIVVTGATPVIERASASLGVTIDRAMIEALPNPGRNPFILAATSPAVISTGSPQFVRMQDQNQASMLAVAGGPRRANTYRLDGVPIEDLFSRAVLIPSIEAVEEVRVQVMAYDAEAGRTGGGVFNVAMRSGTNTWRGSTSYLTRPEWGVGTQFFTRKAGQSTPETSYHLWTGAVGGPLVKGRTFFWASTEGYHSLTAPNVTLTLPTARERVGDYSQSSTVIYDPRSTRPDPAQPGQFIRDPFPGNVIPTNRIDPVARHLAASLPVPAIGRSLARTARLEDLTNQATVKVDHRLSERHALSGLFAWYHSNEPATPSYDGVPGDPGGITSPRTTRVLALNSTSTLGDWTTLALRYGLVQFDDDGVWRSNDPSSLGFDPAFNREIRGFPAIFAEGYGSSLFDGGSNLDQTHRVQVVNALWSRLVGRQVLKAGAEYRRLSLRVDQGRNSTFTFTPGFTRGPDANGSANGDAFASFLLGVPANGGFSIATPQHFFTNYVAGFVQDDVRVGGNLTLNLGLRYELEQGLQEANNAFTVGFDSDRPFPVQVPGLDLKGGLMYAGVDGYSTRQGRPTNLGFGPRAAAIFTMGPLTVARAGYGLFWAPSQIPQVGNAAGFGTRGFTGATTYVASDNGGLTPCGSCSLSNPFPGGVEAPQGAALGLLTGAGGDIDFVDQAAGSAHVHRFSVDLQRELPGRFALTLGYIGSRAQGLALGGTVDATININQLDPQYMALGTALQQPVANPFFGRPEFGAQSTSPTIARGQLLRPYPQFGQVRAHRVSAARSHYDAVVVSAERRQHAGWSARVNYTYSVLKDNQSGEGNAFTNAVQAAIDNRDLEREYGYSVRDAPHRLNVTATVDLPFGEGRRWLSRGGAVNAVLGGWSVSVIGFYQSGFPVAIIQNAGAGATFGFGQRPNRVPGVSPVLTDDPVNSFDPTCLCVRWLNPEAWTAAPAFTFGNAPRADPDARTPGRANWDVGIQKTIAVARARFTLRAEMINVLNDPGFFGPLITFGPANFGQIRRSGNFPRTLQLSVRAGW
ncbi:MAG: TonB-dependent receptor [Vicinamibacterales bacterium]